MKNSGASPKRILVVEDESAISQVCLRTLISVVECSQLLLDKDIPDDVRQDIEVVNREAWHATKMVKKLLTSARKHPPAKQFVNKHTIKKVLELPVGNH